MTNELSLKYSQDQSKYQTGDTEVFAEVILESKMELSQVKIVTHHLVSQNYIDNVLLVT